MRLRHGLIEATFLLAFAAALPLALMAAPNPKEAVCYIVVKEGNSADANKLYLKMISSSEAVTLVAPTRFSFGKRTSFTSVEGNFRYEGGQPVLVARKGKLVLYSIDISFEVDSFPKAISTQTIDIKVADLVKGEGNVQPATKAIELAAAKAKLKSGTAWVVGMSMPNAATIRVQVAFAK